MPSRREFLRAAGIGAAAWLAARFKQARAQDDLDEDLSYNKLFGNPPLLGRVHGAYWIRAFKGPGPGTGAVGVTYYWGNVMPIYRSVHGEPYDARAKSSVWFETDKGYVHSAYVVPCHEIFNEPEDVHHNGVWGEISVPVSFQHDFPTLDSMPRDYSWYMGFWGQVHRVVEMAEDETGRAWYRLFDDEEPKRQAWVQAKHVRLIRPEEFAPISPDVENKQLEINLDDQTLTCYEHGVVVFKTRIASGTVFRDDEGKEHDFLTTYGEYNVQRKRPSRRMRGGEGTDLAYDVNGVPWVTYFTGTGAAIHGAYWHNNFGTPRSHGCINVIPDAGKWIYRWTQPHADYDDEYRWTESGELTTPVVVL